MLRFGMKITRDRKQQKHNRSGLTLIEMVLAMALLGTMLLATFPVFDVSLNIWKRQDSRQQVIQTARVAMARITEELRYGSAVSGFGSNLVEFTTQYVEDSDADDEVIRYELSSSSLYRSVDGGIQYLVADNVSSFETTYTDSEKKVELYLVVSDGTETFALKSAAHLRNS